MRKTRGNIPKQNTCKTAACSSTHSRLPRTSSRERQALSVVRDGSADVFTVDGWCWDMETTQVPCHGEQEQERVRLWLIACSLGQPVVALGTAGSGRPLVDQLQQRLLKTGGGLPKDCCRTEAENTGAPVLKRYRQHRKLIEVSRWRSRAFVCSVNPEREDCRGHGWPKPR